MVFQKNTVMNGDRKKAEILKKHKSAKEQKFLANLSKSLFWDTSINSIDPEKNASYIIERVMTRGTMEDFQNMKAYYGKTRVRLIVAQLRHLDDHTLHFCSAYFKIPLNQFRCYIQKQSSQAHWNY